jgi:hypothetical protein
MRGYGAIVALGLLGLWLIWKGLTGDVMRTRFGEAMIPRWMYVLGGFALLLFPLAYIYFVQARAWR